MIEASNRLFAFDDEWPGKPGQPMLGHGAWPADSTMPGAALPSRVAEVRQAWLVGTTNNRAEREMEPSRLEPTCLEMRGPEPLVLAQSGAPKRALADPTWMILRRTSAHPSIPPRRHALDADPASKEVSLTSSAGSLLLSSSANPILTECFPPRDRLIEDEVDLDVTLFRRVRTLSGRPGDFSRLSGRADLEHKHSCSALTAPACVRSACNIARSNRRSFRHGIRNHQELSVEQRAEAPGL
ncbi:hypothetical protein PCL_08515 [Purpureocillium lilacinum]|uniref:Uncharacterized protein n=1 Tax=Purpureocillium lilacinum TaxID=33203 RepID=A0A2U3DRB9_PURLI|nr:hypothetical protein PCL_08515 [Purpureocillium lilacinum]